MFLIIVITRSSCSLVKIIHDLLVVEFVSRLSDSFFFIFTIAFAGYYVYQGNINEKLIAKKIEEERIEKNKKD